MAKRPPRDPSSYPLARRSIPGDGALIPAGDLAAGRRFLAASKAGNTRRAYQNQWKWFEEWCRLVKACSLPASGETLHAYLSARAEGTWSPPWKGAPRKPKPVKYGTIAQIHAAIKAIHSYSARAFAKEHPDEENPFDPNPADLFEIQELLDGIANEKAGEETTRKKPVTPAQLRCMVQALDLTTLRGLRDRAVLLVGFSSACRRAELVERKVSDLEFDERGVRIRIGKSKTDQKGKGRLVGIIQAKDKEIDPVSALKAWLEAAEIENGPIFRPVSRGGTVGEHMLSSNHVAEIVKAGAEACDLDPTRYSGHSLRRGYATWARKKRKDVWAIMAQTGHSNTETLGKYIELDDPYESTEGLLDEAT